MAENQYAKQLVKDLNKARDSFDFEYQRFYIDNKKVASIAARKALKSMTDIIKELRKAIHADKTGRVVKMRRR